MPYKDPNKASEYSKKYSKRWRLLNKEKVKEYQEKNKDKIRLKTNKWQRDNPDKVLKSMKSHFERYGNELNISLNEYSRSLSVWSKLIRNKNNNMCKICEDKAVLTHHIFYKSKYPKLSLNENNGIPLCYKCHKEFHDLNGWR